MRDTNRFERRCDGIRRRDILHVGALTALGLGLSDWFRWAPSSASGATSANTSAPACILIWLDGGPSHLETFDLKPDAPREVRGPFEPIGTNVPGIQISEYLPRTAQVMDRVALIRSMTSTLGEHNFASHYMLTGYRPTPALQYPGLGAVVTHLANGDATLPPHLALQRPNAMAGHGFLPAATDPFVIDGDPARPDFSVRDLSLYTGMSRQRLERRREFRSAIDALDRGIEIAHANADADANANIPTDPAFERAYRLIFSPQAKAAFDLDNEPDALRNHYGRHTLGQSCLLARRLVEAGARFVTVTDRGWDTHDNLYNRLKEGYTGGTAGKIPKLDTAYAALIEDLHQRGMLDNTLVVLMGEFGRTPKLNTLGGRDHWPRAFSVALAGASVRGGQVIGSSDSRGENPDDRPTTPADLAHTIYTALGIDPNRQLTTADGRPVPINKEGNLIDGLLT